MLNPIKCTFILVLAFGAFSLTETQTNYCNTNLCGAGKTHIACNNKGNFKAACSANARMVPMNASLRRALVDRHNYYRNIVANGDMKRFEPAVRMAPMRWNKQLAQLAALNVKQCVMDHDQCHNTRLFKLSGQNLAIQTWGGKDWKVTDIAMKQIRSWFIEHKHAQMAYINKLPGKRIKGIGHFTAMMQEKSTHIGCAILRQTKNGSTNQLMACNYARTNIVDKAVYRKGRTGSQCRTGRHGRFKGLCSLREKYAVNKA